MLYVRMGIMMLITLYTSRVVLQNLGVVDYGIYNVVGSVVVMFSFLSITLEVAIRRFVAVEIGKGGNEIETVFLSSVLAILIVAAILVIGLETIGLWFVNNKLSIPPDRVTAASWAYQFALSTFLFNLLLIPFSATIVAYEHMNAYAFFGIIDAFLRLFIALLLKESIFDRLIYYSGLMMTASIMVAMMNASYCWFKLLRIKKWRIKDFSYLKSILKFSGWSVVGSMVYVFTTQGVNMIFNMFWGVTVNAAIGIANQASGALGKFTSSFQVAYNPQLTKNYAVEGLSDKTFNFLCRVTKVVILLILVLGYSMLCNLDELLHIWLTIVPDYALEFCVIAIFVVAIEGLAAPLYILVYAEGNVKLYQIVLSIIQLVYISIVYFLCCCGLTPTMVYSINIVCYLAMYFARFLILKKIMNFNIWNYIIEIYKPLVLPLIILAVIFLVVTRIELPITIINTLLKTSICAVISVTTMGVLYFSKEEKMYLFNIIKSKLR